MLFKIYNMNCVSNENINAQHPNLSSIYDKGYCSIELYKSVSAVLPR